MSSKPNKKQPLTKLNFVFPEKLTIYGISESELESLERGSQEPIFFTIGISLLSFGFGCLLALCTASNLTTKMIWVISVVVAICLITGFIFLLLWWLNRGKVVKITDQIRKRQQPLPSTPSS